MKKLFALALALVMALGLTTVAWGADPVTDESGLNTAITAGGEVVLGGNVEITTTITISNTVTVDLAGYKLTGPDDGQSNWYAFVVASGGKLTLKDSSAAQTGVLWAKCYGVETKGGTFVMESGKIDATTNGGIGAAIVNYGGTVIVNDGELVASHAAVNTQSYFAAATTDINGGTMKTKSTTSAVVQVGGEYSKNTETVTVDDGEIVGDVAVSVEKDTADVTIAGGDVKGSVAASAGDLAVSGGTFDTDVSTYVTSGANVTSTVLPDAVNNVITLTNNVELSAELVLPEGVTLDGNGYTISVADGVTWSTSNDTKHLLELGNNTTVKNVTLDSEGKAYGVQAYKATGVKLDNVTIKNSKGAGLTVNGSTVEAVNLKASGNAWGSVNVDPGTGVTTESNFAISGANTNLADTTAIWGDEPATTNDPAVKVTISGGTYSGAISVPEKAGSVAISGGTFSSAVPEKYAADGYTPVIKNGVFTVGTASTSSTGNNYSSSTNAGTTTTVNAVDKYEIYPANSVNKTAYVVKSYTTLATKTVTKDGVTTKSYIPAYYTVDAGTKLYEADATSGTLRLFKNGQFVTYLNELDEATAAGGFTSDYISDTATYVAKAKGCGTYGVNVYKLADGNAYAVNPNGRFVAMMNGKVVVYDGAVAPVPHTFTDEVTYKSRNDLTVVSIKCDKCGKSFQVVKSIPANYIGATTPLTVDGTAYTILLGTASSTISTGTTTGTVQSAATFDAGIALYVGMSVLAATGSAVVIGKKKD